jgi:hypothetical protein
MRGKIIKPGEMQKRLEAISNDKGVAYLATSRPISRPRAVHPIPQAVCRYQLLGYSDV